MKKDHLLFAALVYINFNNVTHKADGASFVAVPLPRYVFLVRTTLHFIAWVLFEYPEEASPVRLCLNALLQHTTQTRDSAHPASSSAEKLQLPSPSAYRT